MRRENGKLLYVVMGIGCGMIISGIVMVIIGLQAGKELTALQQEYESKIKVLETQLTLYDKHLMNGEDKEKETQKTNTISEEIEYVWINIPTHYGATQIANLLEQSGIVDDAIKFNDFLIREQMTRKLRTGPKFLPLNGAYNEILAILLGQNE